MKRTDGARTQHGGDDATAARLGFDDEPAERQTGAPEV
jgi:hypothetical protein